MSIKYYVRINFNSVNERLSYFAMSTHFRTFREFEDYEEATKYIDSILVDYPEATPELTKVTFEPMEYKPDPLLSMSKEELARELKKFMEAEKVKQTEKVNVQGTGT